MDQNSKEKKLFFFGQPGCLKVKVDIPIRPSENSDSQSDDNEIGEKSNSKELSESKQIEGTNSPKKAENSSDDDGEELLKKIDAALEVKNEHQDEENSGTLLSVTSKETTINDASNNHVDEVSTETIHQDPNNIEGSTETIQKDPNNIEKQNYETRTNEESQNKCKEESALEKPSSANTETITEKIVSVYNVKSIENNIKVNEENNLNEDECKPIELKNEEISAKPLETVEDKSEETDNIVESLIKPNESKEKNCEPVETGELKSSIEIQLDEKFHSEGDEKTDENIKKEKHSENLASELHDDQTENRESSVNNEVIDPVMCKSVQNNAISQENTSSEISSSLLTEKGLNITISESQHTTDSTDVSKLPDVSNECLTSDNRITESVSEVNEEQTTSESVSSVLPEDIKSNEAPNDENTCPSHEPQVLPNETSIKIDEESVPKNDNLEHKTDIIETKEKALQSDDKNINSSHEKQLEVTATVEKNESQIQESEPSHDVFNKNENESQDAQIKTQKVESSIEVENIITETKEKSLSEENLNSKIEIIENTEVSSSVSCLEEEKIEDSKCSHDQVDLTSEQALKITKDDQALVLVQLRTENYKDNTISDQIVSDHDNEETSEKVTLEAGSISVESKTKDSNTMESTSEETKIIKSNIIESADIKPCSDLGVDTLKESQMIETVDQNLNIAQEIPVQLQNISKDTDSIKTSEEIETKETENVKKCIIEEISTFVDQNKDKESLPESSNQSENVENILEKHHVMDTNSESKEKTDINVNLSTDQEQNPCLMESEECAEKGEILENNQQQNIDVNSEISVDQVYKEGSPKNEIKNQVPESMEIEDDEIIERDSQVESSTEMTIQVDSETKQDQFVIQAPKECESSDETEVMEVNDQKTDIHSTNYIESVSVNTIDLESDKTVTDEILKSKNIGPKSEVSIKNENVIKVEEVQQNVDALECKTEGDTYAKEINTIESLNDDSIDDVKPSEMPNITEMNQKSENLENYSVGNMLSDQVKNESNIENQHQESKINIKPTASIIEMKPSIEDDRIPVENAPISTVTTLEANEIVKLQSINEDENNLNQQIEIISEKNEEDQAVQIDENLKLESCNEHKDFNTEKESASICKIEENLEIEEKVESQSIEEIIENQNEHENHNSQQSMEKLNEIHSSAGVETEETLQVSDEPEVLKESFEPEIIKMSKESFEHDEAVNKQVETQPESNNEDESLNQNINESEIPPICTESEESQKLESEASNEKDPQELVDLKEMSSSDSIMNETDAIAQKLITVEENSNEKINDNQVELSKIDNKSSSFEKVSPLENINIQNEISKDLVESNTKPIVEISKVDEGSSVSHADINIQSSSEENIETNSCDLNTEEKKVMLETKKQYEQVTESRAENKLTDKNNDDEKCKGDINVKISKEVVVEKLTEKIILNEMPLKEVCADNNQDNDETQNDPKQLMELDSKCSKIVTQSIEKIAINVEIQNESALKNSTEMLDDKSNIEASRKKEILSMPDPKPLVENTSSFDQKKIAEAVLKQHVELEADDKSYLDDSGSKEILSMDTLKSLEKDEQIQVSETVLIKHIEIATETCTSKNVEQQNELPPVDPFEAVNSEPQTSNVFDDLLDKETDLQSIPITKSFQKPVPTRKRKMSERKSISESDSDGGSHFVTDSVSNEKSSDEETVATKKPRIRNKITATRNTRATRQSARVSEETKSSPEVKVKEQKKPEDEEKTLQNLKFDYDENEDIASKMAAIKTLICKETPKKAGDDDDDDSNESSADESSKQKPIRKGRKGKRGRTGKKNDAEESSSDDSKSSKLPDSKRSKTSESEETAVEKQTRKKRDSTGKGLLKYIDTSLVIETVETEAPIRQSRRIAQQKIKEETERRQMEEKMLKQMKAEAEKKKKMALIPGPPDEDVDNDRSSDESYKDSTKKKKTKIKPSDKQWQTSSSHSENSESEDEFERPPSEDPGSPLFRSDHEFSPESDDDEAPVQPVKRARTAKKQVEESSDDEDVNPNHACQVCHKTDSPEWILLCDECDHGYHCSCLKPIIFCIPSGNWYCPLCCHKKLVDDLSVQLEKLDTLIVNIKAEEIRQQKQLEIKKLAEITQENILNDKRKKRSEIKVKEEQSRGSKTRRESSNDESESNDDESSENSSDNEPLNEMFYKLRKRNQTIPSYRFNDYDDLINSAIKRDMDEVKGMGNAGRGKDISTIIEADKEEKKLQKIDQEKDTDEKDDKQSNHQKGEESSGSEIVRPKKAIQRKKKNRKLNNLDATSEEDQASDEDFKGTPSSNSDTEEEYSISSNDVSESSLDLPLKKGKAGKRSTRSAAKNRRYDETFIDDNSSDDEPLIKKRIRKQRDSDEEEFDANEENSDGSTPEDIDSEDLCDDTESDDSSESNWPKKKKKRNASYDIKKPRRNPKKTDGGKDKAFRAGISKKKILKVSDNESEASDNESDKGRRRTRGKKLLYLIEDDYESDDGIKPGIGVVRPETPPEERELFVKKQEEIKRMLAEKNTEAARQLAVPTIEPIQFALEKPESPVPPPLTSDELASLSTIPKNVIEGAKALDMDYNKIKPIHFGVHSKSSDHPSAHDMSEEDLARMMEEEDFAQHQLKMVGETINRNKLLELEVKEEAFANIEKGGKIKEEKELEKLVPAETKKRARKPKQEKQPVEHSSPPAKLMQTEAALQKVPATQHITQLNVSTPLPIAQESSKPHSQNIPSVPPLISNPVGHSPYPNLPPRYSAPHHLNIQDRPSVLSNYIPRHEGMPPRLDSMPPRLGMPPRFEGMLSRLEAMGPRMQAMPPRLEGMASRLDVGSPQQHLRFPNQPPEGFSLKSPPIAPQLPPSQPANEEVEEKKKGRRKKYTPLRTDLIDSNASKVAKLDTPTTSSVIHSTLNLSTERPDDKSKVSLPPLQRAKPEIFNPATNPPSSVITRLLQPQQRPPFGGFAEQMNVSVTSASNPNAPTNPRAFPEDMKHLPISKQIRPGQQAQFPEIPFVPRGMHTLYRGPPTTQPSIYGIPSHHARIPYPFHLHPNNNLRPNMQEYGAPYNIPPQFGYYAPPAHSRQHPPNTTAPPLSHQEHSDIPPNNVRPNNNINPNDEPSESSEFGGLVSYFSSQQELD